MCPQSLSILRHLAHLAVWLQDLQEFLVDQGLGAVVQVLHFVGRPNAFESCTPV